MYKRQGKDNVVADILSRNPTDATPEEVNEDIYEYLVNHITIKMDKEVGIIIRDIGKYQLNDIKLKTIINKISVGSVDKELSEFYKYVNGNYTDDARTTGSCMYQIAYL